MTPEQVLEEMRRLRRTEAKLAVDKHKFALATGWGYRLLSKGLFVYWKTPEHGGEEVSCMIDGVIAREFEWAKPKCDRCGKYCRKDELDEVGFCDYCAING